MNEWVSPPWAHQDTTGWRLSLHIGGRWVLPPLHHRLAPYCPLVGQTNKCRTTVFFYFNYFVSLIRPFIFQCSLFHISIKKCNQKAMEACFFFFFFKNNYQYLNVLYQQIESQGLEEPLLVLEAYDCKSSVESIR